jgi:hypothetical protein
MKNDVHKTGSHDAKKDSHETHTHAGTESHKGSDDMKNDVHKTGSHDAKKDSHETHTHAGTESHKGSGDMKNDAHEAGARVKNDGTVSHDHPGVKSLHISTHDKTGLYKSETEHAKFEADHPHKPAVMESPKVSDEGKTGMQKAGSHLTKPAGPTVMSDVKKNGQKEKNDAKAGAFAAPGSVAVHKDAASTKFDGHAAASAMKRS